MSSHAYLSRMSRHYRPLLLLVPLLLGLSGSTSAPACQLLQAPAATDYALIDAGECLRIDEDLSLSGDIKILGELVLAKGRRFDLASGSRITIAEGGKLTVAGNLSAAEAAIAVEKGGTLDNAGNLSFNFSGELDNAGTVATRGSFYAMEDSRLKLLAGSTFRASGMVMIGGSTLEGQGAQVSNAGTMQVIEGSKASFTQGATLDNSGAFTIGTGCPFALSGNSHFNNPGKLVINGKLQIADKSAVVNTGAIEQGPQGKLQRAGASSLTGGGTFTQEK